MIIATIAFYVFAAITVAAGVMVISSRNPVHSVLFLILAFFNAAGLFVLMGAEFIAMILVIVYVGAVAVLFLFVVMMLDSNFVELRQGFRDRQGALYRLHLSVPGRRPDPADRHDRRDRADAADARGRQTPAHFGAGIAKPR